MKWMARIYRPAIPILGIKSENFNGAGPSANGNEVAKLPVDGAESSGQVYEMAEEIIRQEPGTLSFEKTEKTPPESAGVRSVIIKNKKYIIVVEQTG